MKSPVPSLVLVILGMAILGCSQKADVTPPPDTPHGGVLIPLPEDQGFVELLNGAPVPAAEKKVTFPILAYLLQPDRKSAVASPPKELTVKYELKGQETAVNLPLTVDSADPAGSARFASAPTSLEINRGEAGGVIEFDWNGKKIAVNFRGKQ